MIDELRRQLGQIRDEAVDLQKERSGIPWARLRAVVFLLDQAIGALRGIE